MILFQNSTKKFKFNTHPSIKDGVTLHSQQKVRFREYFEYFLVG